MCLPITSWCSLLLSVQILQESLILSEILQKKVELGAFYSEFEAICPELVAFYSEFDVFYCEAGVFYSGPEGICPELGAFHSEFAVFYFEAGVFPLGPEPFNFGLKDIYPNLQSPIPTQEKPIYNIGLSIPKMKPSIFKIGCSILKMQLSISDISHSISKMQPFHLQDRLSYLQHAFFER
jgi:hypothetical protein